MEDAHLFQLGRPGSLSNAFVHLEVILHAELLEQPEDAVGLRVFQPIKGDLRIRHGGNGRRGAVSIISIVPMVGAMRRLPSDHGDRRKTFRERDMSKTTATRIA